MEHGKLLTNFASKINQIATEDTLELRCKILENDFTVQMKQYLEVLIGK